MRSHSKAMLFALAALTSLLAIAPAASASHTVGGYIGGQGAGLGGPAGEFLLPRDAAYYQGTDADPATDKILVLEGGFGGQRVHRLGRHGGFERMWGSDVLAGNSDFGGEVCTAAQFALCQIGQDSFDGTLAGEFDDARGIAVNQSTGHVYVWDAGNARVQQFDLDGSFIRAWGWGVTDGSAELQVCEVAADCQASVPGPGLGQFDDDTSLPANGIAVDPTTEQVYVIDPGNSRLQRFDADGSNPVAIGEGEFGSGQPRSVAVAANGVVFASDSQSSGEIERYDSAGVHGPVGFLEPIHATNATLTGPLAQGSSSGTGTAPSATEGLEIDPDTGALYVLRNPSTGNTRVQQLGPVNDPAALEPPAAEDASHGGPSLGTGSHRGLGYSPVSDEFHIVDDFSSSSLPGHGLVVLTDAPGALEEVTVDAPSGVGTDSATLNGTIDANTGVVRGQFEISTDGVSFQPAGLPVYASGSGPIEVSATVSGLDPNTLHRVRLRATKLTSLSSFDQVDSGESSFITDAIPAEAETLAATAVRSTSAALQASVDPNGSQTTYYFQYGTTAGYGSTVPAIPAPAGAGADPILVSEPLTGLDPDTTYHFRVVADNGIEVSPGDTSVEGQDLTLRTRPVATAPPSRGYELVSPAYKEGGQGVGMYAPGDVGADFAGFASPQGNRYLVGTRAGSVLLDGKFSYANDWAFAERVSDSQGWVSRSPFTRTNHGSAYSRFANITAFSEDFSLIAWGANAAHIGLFPEVDPWPQPVAIPTLGDWRGRYEVLGPTHPDQGEGDGTSKALPLRQAVSADGTHVAFSSTIRGLNTNDPLGADGVFDPEGAGDDNPFYLGDPTLDQAPKTVTAYVDDVSAGLSDSFPGEGIREPLGVCDAGTTIPGVDAEGKLEARECPPPTEYGPGLFRDAALIDSRGTSLGVMADNVISEDGSRIFFTTPTMTNGTTLNTPCSGTGATTECPSQLYVRYEDQETGEVSTRWISKPQIEGQDASLLGPAIFEAATPDGDKVYFRTASPLSVDDPNGDCGAPCTSSPIEDSSWDLYEYDFTDTPSDDPGEGALTRISAGPGGEADPNASAGFASGGAAYSLRFLADAGNRLYFTTAGPIAGAANPGNGTITEPGGEAANGSVAANASNLYLYEPGSAEPYRFVARLDRGRAGDPAEAMRNCATVSGGRGTQIKSKATADALIRSPGNCVSGFSDGELITFLTESRLVAGDPDTTSVDVYGFDADISRLTRISAPQQGGAGGLYECAEGVHCRADNGIGQQARLAVTAQPPGAKAVFFQSKARLLPTDKDDHYDVYRWREGELSLFSIDTDEPAYYMGASVEGTDVFIQTASNLSWQDTDAVRDIYTARLGGGIPEPPAPPPACGLMAGACQDDEQAEPRAVEVQSTAPTQGNVAGTVPRRSGPSRCAKLGRNARVTSRNARRFRRMARKARGPRANKLMRRARRAARNAKRTSRGAKRCRARAARASRRAGR